MIRSENELNHDHPQQLPNVLLKRIPGGGVLVVKRGSPHSEMRSVMSERRIASGEQPLEVGPWYYVWDDVVIGAEGEIYRPVGVESLLAWIKNAAE